MNETDTLQGLINKARRERDKSIRQMAFEAQAAGHRIVGTTLNAIENGTYKSMPSDDTIRAIGWLASVSDEVSFAAAGRTPPGPPFAEELPPGVDELSPKERGAVIDLLRTLVAMRQEINRNERSNADNSSTPQPGTPSEAERENEEVKATGLSGPKQGRRLDVARSDDLLNDSELDPGSVGRNLGEALKKVKNKPERRKVDGS